MIKFRCKDCGQKISTEDDAAGLTVNCPNCKAVVEVQAVNKSAPFEMAPPVQKPVTQAQVERKYYQPFFEMIWRILLLIGAVLWFFDTSMREAQNVMQQIYFQIAYGANAIIIALAVLLPGRSHWYCSGCGNEIKRTTVTCSSCQSAIGK